MFKKTILTSLWATLKKTGQFQSCRLWLGQGLGIGLGLGFRLGLVLRMTETVRYPLLSCL